MCLLGEDHYIELIDNYDIIKQKYKTLCVNMKDRLEQSLISQARPGLEVIKLFSCSALSIYGGSKFHAELN